MYRCESCGNDFDKPILVKDSESGDFNACPRCGKAEYYEIIECPECGKIEYIEDMPLYCGMCRECFVSKYNNVLGFKYFMSLPKKEKSDALKYIYCIDGQLRGNAYIALLNDFICKYNESAEHNPFNFYFADYLREWIFEDLKSFAEWCEDNGGL